MGERKFRKFSVHGTRWLQLAAIEIEAARRKGAEIERAFALDGAMQAGEIRPLFDTSQRQVRRVFPLLAVDSQGRSGRVGVGGQLSQARSIDAAPEITRRFRVGKESHVVNTNFDRFARG